MNKHHLQSNTANANAKVLSLLYRHRHWNYVRMFHLTSILSCDSICHYNPSILSLMFSFLTRYFLSNFAHLQDYLEIYQPSTIRRSDNSISLSIKNCPRYCTWQQHTNPVPLEINVNNRKPVHCLRQHSLEF